MPSPSMKAVISSFMPVRSSGCGVMEFQYCKPWPAHPPARVGLVETQKKPPTRRGRNGCPGRPRPAIPLPRNFSARALLPARNLLRLFCGFRFSRVALGILAAEALHPASGIHKLLLAGKEWMAGSADFHADVALVGGTGDECIPAGAMHADFTVMRMNGCFHVSFQTSNSELRFYRS